MIQQIEKTLNTMKMGIDQYENSSHDQSQKDAGLRNAVVFGRAVTNSLQKLRGTEVGREDFDAWYTPWQKKLKEDPGFKFLYKLRSQILKEGILKTSSGIKINHLNLVYSSSIFISSCLVNFIDSSSFSCNFISSS